jgi:hypothetical protein
MKAKEEYLVNTIGFTKNPKTSTCFNSSNIFMATAAKDLAPAIKPGGQRWWQALSMNWQKIDMVQNTIMNITCLLC